MILAGGTVKGIFYIPTDHLWRKDMEYRDMFVLAVGLILGVGIYWFGYSKGKKAIIKKLTREIDNPYRDDDPMRNSHRVKVEVIRHGNKVRYLDIVPGSTEMYIKR